MHGGEGYTGSGQPQDQSPEGRDAGDWPVEVDGRPDHPEDQPATPTEDDPLVDSGLVREEDLPESAGSGEGRDVDEYGEYLGTLGVGGAGVGDPAVTEEEGDQTGRNFFGAAVLEALSTGQLHPDDAMRIIESLAEGGDEPTVPESDAGA